MKTTRERIVDGLYIVWTIAAKDLVDAVKSKLVVSLIIGLSIMLLLPKMMSLIIAPPYTEVAVYDPGSSRLVGELEDSPQFRLRKASSAQELEGLLINSMNCELGLAVPTDLDQVLESGGQPKLDGYVTWANRTKAPGLKSDFEQQIAELLGQPVHINIEGNIVYPPPDSGLLLGMVTSTAIVIIIMMGITLVPNLLFEEKQTKTMEALLVSPASIGQVVMGKALAGLFYVLVTAGVVFAVNWTGVVHWGLAILFAISIGLFATAVGLVLGSFFERPQDVTGWTGLLLVVFAGSMFVDMVGLQIPTFIQTIVPWVPSVALAEVFRFAFSEDVAWAQVWTNLGIVLGVSTLLYAIVVWKVRRWDR